MMCYTSNRNNLANWMIMDKPVPLRPICDLSERNIKAATAGQILRDTDIAGLHLKATATKKAFYLWFRTKAGVERRPKLGDWGSITLTQARGIAKSMLARVAVGEDPSADFAAARSEPALGDLWDEYWKRHGSKKKSADEDQRMYDSYILSRLKNRKLSSIGYKDVADLVEAMAATPVQANRVLALLSKMFNFAKAPLRWTKENPCEGVKRYKERKRRRKATPDEIATVVRLLREELEGPNLCSAAFLWLLLTTGARKGEISVAKWTELDGNRLLLDEHKTDEGGYARIIQFPRVAMDVVALLPRTNGTLTGIVDPKALWDKLRKKAGCPDLRMHDLRRTFASVALSTGQVTLDQVMQMLGHTSAQTTLVYAWLMEDAHREATALTGDRIVGALAKPVL